MINLLQYLGAILAISGQGVRALYPKLIISSFVLSGLAALTLGIYAFYTGQWGLLLLNVNAEVFSIIGLVKWNGYKVEEK